MADQLVALSVKSATAIQKALEELAKLDPPRQITGLAVKNGDLVIKHVPKL